jgi:hypothetical protein
VSPEPTVEPRRLSPDGLWHWDGAQWVPATPGASPMPPRRSSRSSIWWVAGGCVALLVIGGVAVGFGAYSIVNRFHHGGFSCLPSDFPSYPGASVVSENIKVGANLYPGDNTECRMVLQSDDNVDTVANFYRQNLGTGDWTILTYLYEGAFSFQRNSRRQTMGTIYVDAKGQHTQMEIYYNS